MILKLFENRIRQEAASDIVQMIEDQKEKYRKQAERSEVDFYHLQKKIVAVDVLKDNIIEKFNLNIN